MCLFKLLNGASCTRPTGLLQHKWNFRLVCCLQRKSWSTRIRGAFKHVLLDKHDQFMIFHKMWKGFSYHDLVPSHKCASIWGARLARLSSQFWVLCSKKNVLFLCKNVRWHVLLYLSHLCCFGYYVLSLPAAAHCTRCIWCAAVIRLLSENHVLYCVGDITLQCVFLNVGNVSYLCELLNKVEKN